MGSFVPLHHIDKRMESLYNQSPTLDIESGRFFAFLIKRYIKNHDKVLKFGTYSDMININMDEF